VVQFYGDAVVAIPGTASARQACRNTVVMMNFRLTSAVLDLLNELSQLFAQNS